MTLCAGLSYSIILGDSFAGIAALAGAKGLDERVMQDMLDRMDKLGQDL